MPVPQWLQANPFRILRLSADASIAETHKAASAMRRMTVLGMLNTSDADVPSLGDVPRTETDIRAAVGRLENPAQRIADRLFWIRSAIEKPETATAGAPLKKAAREHDEAWNGLVRIYTLPELPDDATAWIAPLRLWQQTIENDDYWKLSFALDQLGAFEPPASADEFSGLRARAMMLASEPLIMLARQAVANGDRRALEMALRILRELSDTGDWPASARKEILAPLRNSVSERCRLNRENFGKRIVRHSDSAAANGQICNDALRDFRTSVETSFTNLGASLAGADTERLEASEEVARCLSDIAIDFTWADRYLESEELFKEALSLAQGTLAAVQIERSLAENKDSADHQRVYEGLSPESIQALKGAQKACQSVLADGRKQILREQDKSDHNRPLCQAMLARFRSEIQPAMTSALTQVGTEHPATKERGGSGKLNTGIGGGSRLKWP